jgi:inhibitor of the pro-sigma K processing machinery
MSDIPDWNLIAAAIFGLFVLYFILRMFYKPLKIVFITLMHIIMGGAVIILYNLAGSVWGLTVGFNVISAFIIGVMGLPGLGMLIALRYIFS